ncbi:MAG TPA: exosortase-associated EpsI family protein [Bdellovibrionota bacterium]|nr:exosortase-associated EpsI family protein [Bdellovibrionota bacterium]
MKKNIILFISAVLLLGFAFSGYFYFKKSHVISSEVATQKYRFVTDVGYYYFTSHESKITLHGDFLDKKTLSKLPLKLGHWVGQDVDHNFPDLLHYRFYFNEKTKDILWLISVHGTHESQFHTAEVCYIVDGWDVAQRAVKSINLEGEELRVRYMKAIQGKTTHVGVYWYMWKNSQRRMREGTVMLRLSVELKESDEKALEAIVDFVKELKNAKINP